MSGGFGTGPIKKIVESIYAMEPALRDRIQVMVICGNNKDLFEELNRKKKAFLEFNLHVFGYMDNIDEFMEIADSIVTKSGGLTISEALSKKLPMIIIQPIPGQEERNSTILTGYGAAVRADTVDRAIYYIKDFISSPEKIIGMRARISLLAYPNAARAIARFVQSGRI
jgi:processive 1,2-diacylglycerol beta-glucosyltransferase